MDRRAKAPPFSHSQIEMARELGLNPAKLRGIDNHKQEPWKLLLPQFIEQLYFERFGKTSPTTSCPSRSYIGLKREKGK
jgi:hypothetical protein